MSKKLKLKYEHAQFVQEYLVDFNATQAYLRVYPDCTQESAEASGPRLLGNVGVKEAIDQGAKYKIKRAQMTQDKVLSELALIANQNVKNLYDKEGNLIPVHLLPDDVSKTIQSIEIQEMAGDYEIEGEPDPSKNIAMRVKRIKTYDKKSALTDYGKHLGLFPNKTEIAGPGGGPVEHRHSSYEIVDPLDNTEEGKD